MSDGRGRVAFVCPWCQKIKRWSYTPGNIFLTDFKFVESTNIVFCKLRFLLADIFVSIWLLKACFLLNPPADFLNLFLAAEFDFIFGIVIPYCFSIYENIENRNLNIIIFM